MREWRLDPRLGGGSSEVLAQLLRRVTTLEMEGNLFIEPEFRKFFDGSGRRAERTIAGHTCSRAMEPTRDEPAHLFRHRPVGRKLAAGYREETVVILEDRMPPRDVGF